VQAKVANNPAVRGTLWAHLRERQARRLADPAAAIEAFIQRWLLCADPWLALLRRSRGGSIVPITKWLQCAGRWHRTSRMKAIIICSNSHLRGMLSQSWRTTWSETNF